MKTDLIKETIESLIDYLPKVIDVTKSTAELFHTEREAAALRNMGELTDAYSWIVDAIFGIQKNKFELQINVNEVLNFLRQIEESLVIQDFIAISDLLEYEVAEILERWLIVLKEQN